MGDEHKVIIWDNKSIKLLLEKFFSALTDDELGCHSADSVLANIHLEKQPVFNMGKIDSYTKDGKIKGVNKKMLAKYLQWFGTKRHKQPKPSKPRGGVSIGGYSKIDNNKVFLILNTTYKNFPPEWRNLLREHVSRGTSYERLAKDFKEYRLTPHQIKHIFARKIYPKIEETLTRLGI